MGHLSVFGKVTISTERQLVPSAPRALLILQQHVEHFLENCGMMKKSTHIIHPILHQPTAFDSLKCILPSKHEDFMMSVTMREM